MRRKKFTLSKYGILTPRFLKQFFFLLRVYMNFYHTVFLDRTLRVLYKKTFVFCAEDLLLLHLKVACDLEMVKSR